MNRWLKDNLVCPRDWAALEHHDRELVCPNGHSYPIVEGIPVMLLEDVEHTHEVAARDTIGMVDAYRRAQQGARQNAHARPQTLAEDEIHPYVNRIVVSTCGKLYRPLLGRLPRYPIPEIGLPRGSGEIILDVGCSWGRWSVAAARKGYLPVGIDPKLEAVIAARDVTRQLNADGIFLVGDVRFLPFRAGTFPIVHSFGVLQHFSKGNVRRALENVARVLRQDGTSLIQMPNLYGLRSLYNHARRGFREGTDFRVRYWTVPELTRTFEDTIGPSTVYVAGYLGLGVLRYDKDMLPWRYKAVVNTSEMLRSMSEKVPWMKYFADSVYLRSRRDAGAGPRAGVDKWTSRKNSV